MKLQVFIFSYNRADFLQNCVRSVQRNLKQWELFVVDDNSDDVATREYLSQLPKDVSVLNPKRGDKSRHGGLYNNMQLALDHADEDSVVLFLQDDMQIVRPVDDQDVTYIDDFFATFTHAAFLNPVFLKGQRAKRDLRITRLDSQFPVYFRHYPSKKNSRGITYADVTLAHTKRLRAHNWQFRQGEIANAAQAEESFHKMGFMRDPFVMFLPQVPVFRGRHKSLPVRLAERWAGNEPKQYLDMTEAEVTELRQRNENILPVAERYLETADSRVKKPFQYSVVNVYPWLRVWHKLNLKWRKLAGK